MTRSKTLLKIVGAFLLLSMLGCVHQEEIDARLGVAQCKMDCQAISEICASKCVNNCLYCQFTSNESTANQYEQFVNEQTVQGGMITRELNSYRDPLQCRKTTCHCSADLAVCYQGCTGVIHKQLSAKPCCN